ncbi:MAG: flavodoxin family protein [Clostridia bacterium]|nr:flavodoxin family protein [Clostridia bacterium]
MKVLLINGSPHETGCTYTALSEVAHTLEEAGVETKILSIGKEDIRGCTACGGCRNGNGCVFGGIVNVIAEEAKTADGFVFGSPVYYASPNGSLMTLMDRLFFSASAHLRHKPAAAVVSARRAGTTTALHDIENYFTITEMPIVASSYWNMVHGTSAEQVAEDGEGLQVMRNLGRNMAWLLSCIEAGKNAGIQKPENEYGIRTNFIR